MQNLYACWFTKIVMYTMNIYYFKYIQINGANSDEYFYILICLTIS